MSRIEEIEAREKAATKGPWHAYPGEKYEGSEQRCDGIYPFPRNQPLPEGGHWTWSGIVITDGGYYPPRMPDASFIAHSRSDIPWLLERVKRLEATLTAVRVEVCALGYPRTDGKYDKDGEWTFEDACPREADAECLLKAMHIMDEALKEAE